MPNMYDPMNYIDLLKFQRKLYNLKRLLYFNLVSVSFSIRVTFEMKGIQS